MTIRTFIRRKQNRMSPAQKRALVTPELNSKRASVNDILNSDKPVILDIGFGMGDSLLALAELYPECLIIGLDIYQPGIARALQLVADYPNVLILEADAVEVLHNLPDACLYGVQLLFPDPWPKKRHTKRRFVQNERLELIYSRLKLQGWLRIVTDSTEYAEHADACVSVSKFVFGHEVYGSNLKTKYWLRALKLGHQIKDFNLIKL